MSGSSSNGFEHFLGWLCCATYCVPRCAAARLRKVSVHSLEYRTAFAAASACQDSLPEWHTRLCPPPPGAQVAQHAARPRPAWQLGCAFHPSAPPALHQCAAGCTARRPTRPSPTALWRFWTASPTWGPLWTFVWWTSSGRGRGRWVAVDRVAMSAEAAPRVHVLAVTSRAVWRVTPKLPGPLGLLPTLPAALASHACRW